jgi:hypothetical protein
MHAVRGKHPSASRWKRGGKIRQLDNRHPLQPPACTAEALEDRTLLSLDGNQLFPSDSPWNHPIADAPVAANSATLVNSIGASSPLHPDLGTTYGGTLNGIPYNVVSGSPPGVNVAIDAYADQSDIEPVPIPANTVIEGDPPAGVAAFSQVPSFVQVSLANQNAYCWAPSTSDASALADPTTAGNSFASAWYSSSNFTVDLDFTDGQAHRVAFYMVDYDDSARTQTVDVINPATSAVLDAQTVSNFSGGEYLVFDLTGNVELKFTNTNSSTTAVLSGIFFGAPGSPAIGGSTVASASFVTADTKTQGSWQGVYGSSGYDLAFPQGEGDRHLIVYNSTTNIGYELYNVHRPSEEPDGQWHADQETVWNFNTDSSPPPGWTSADAAGLSILAGLVRPDETLTQGVVNHALRFTVPKSDSAYVFPATHEAGVNNSALPRMGERFRLESSFNISGFPAADQVILQALKTYGMIVADNGSPWFISGSPSDQWDDDTLHDLTQVIGSDFQAVNLTPVVSGLSQSTGTSSGGNTVTITGVNFQGVASQLQVSFGSMPATNVQVLSDNTLTATVPAQAAGTKVDVKITTPYGTSATSSADQYTYTAAPPPTVVSVTPEDDAGNGVAAGSAAKGQRSMETQISVVFSEPVNLTSGAFALGLVNNYGSGTNNGSADTGLTGVLGTPTNPTGDGETWIIPVLSNGTNSYALKGTNGGISGASLDNGVYQLNVVGADVTAAGGGPAMTANYTSAAWHRLYGDIDNARRVFNTEYASFLAAFTSTYESNGATNYSQDLDTDGDGRVFNTDYSAFLADFGSTRIYTEPQS